MFSSLGRVCSGTRSTICSPKPSRPPRLAGLLVMRRMVVMPEVDEDLGADTVLPAVDRQAQLDVGVDRVEPAVLQLVGLQLVGDADTPSLVAAQVHHRPRARLRRSVRRAACSWAPQSQRRDPNTSPVRHSLCTRTSTLCSPAGSPITNARWVSWSITLW